MGRNQENIVNRNSDSTGSPAYRNSLPYLLIGGGIGATLALLFAPKSGSQLRSEIADVSRKGYEAAAEKAKVINQRSSEIASTIKNKAGAVYDFGMRRGSEVESTFEDAIGELELPPASESNKVAGRMSTI